MAANKSSRNRDITALNPSIYPLTLGSTKFLGPDVMGGGSGGVVGGVGRGCQGWCGWGEGVKGGVGGGCVKGSVGGPCNWEVSCSVGGRCQWTASDNPFIKEID